MKFEIGDGSCNKFPLYGLFTDQGNFAFYEWRWENEQEEFIKEQEEKKRKRDEYHKRIQKPKKMLTEDDFWSVISLIDLESQSLGKAFSFMKKQKISFIKMFEETLSYKLYLLDTKEHAIGCGIYSDTMSADGFLYTRLCAIALGEDYYKACIDNPMLMKCDDDFEDLLQLASNAYESKIKKEFKYHTGCSYESFSNIKGWE